MNRFYFTSVYLCLLISGCQSQELNKEFEGRVEYSIRQLPKGSDSTAKSYRVLYGSGMRAYLKDGRYKQIYSNAAGVEWAMYNNRDNRYYFKIPDIDTLYFVDCSIEPDNYKVAFLEKKDKILEYDCNALELQGGGNKHTVFYAPKLFLNPKHLDANRYHGNNLVTNMSKSVYLKWITEETGVTTIISANSVRRETVADKMFELPKLPQKQVN